MNILIELCTFLLFCKPLCSLTFIQIESSQGFQPVYILASSAGFIVLFETTSRTGRD